MKPLSIVRISFILLCSVMLYFNSHAQVQIYSASCENKINPFGVDINNIHFSWELGAKENGQFQTAYQIVIASSANNLPVSKYDVWNSTVVKSSQSVLVAYNGKNLQTAHITGE
jgi:alpha-L-rhamnosidase